MIVLPLDSSLRGVSAIAFRPRANEATMDITSFHACIQAIQKDLMAGNATRHICCPAVGQAIGVRKWLK